MGEVSTRLAQLRLVPVIVLDDAGDAWPLAQALKAGGLPCAEVTLRTPAAEEALREMAKDPDVLLGAGTVLRPDQVDIAVEAGARFIVTPGYSAAVVERCQRVGVPVIPGVATPTEVQQALEAGLDTVKYFPAEALGGARALAAIAAPYAQMRFVPTGGITAANVGDYLALPSVVAVGGSWMAAKDLVRDGRFDEITRLTAEAVEIAGAAA
jgi:2-dehydro-3-deoxyphosphogluconate aldolase/(4S)-4-hydroxy-2-oxoglutarate aldolase